MDLKSNLDHVCDTADKFNSPSENIRSTCININSPEKSDDLCKDLSDGNNATDNIGDMQVSTLQWNCSLTVELHSLSDSDKGLKQSTKISSKESTFRLMATLEKTHLVLESREKFANISPYDQEFGDNTKKLRDIAPDVIMLDNENGSKPVEDLASGKIISDTKNILESFSSDTYEKDALPLPSNSSVDFESNRGCQADASSVIINHSADKKLAVIEGSDISSEAPLDLRPVVSEHISNISVSCLIDGSLQKWEEYGARPKIKDTDVMDNEQRNEEVESYPHAETHYTSILVPQNVDVISSNVPSVLTT
ncbi:hypothetical protein SK128_009053, partial [Halocaridina rubra]